MTAPGAAGGHPRTLLPVLLAAALWLLSAAGDAEAQGAGEPICPQTGRLSGEGCLVLEAEGATGPETVRRLPALHLARQWQAIVDADVVLLGEVHDNPGHHARRAALIREILAARAALPGRRTGGGIVLEHVRADQQPIIDTFLRAHAAELTATRDVGARSRLLDRLFDALAKPGRTDPTTRLVGPIVDTGIGAGLAIFAGDPPRALVRATAQGGLEAVPADVRRDLGLDQPLEPASAKALMAALVASHCGLVPEAAFGGMAVAQRLRDAHLARAALRAVARTAAAFVITGNEHVRRDRGVPWHLARSHPRPKVVSIMMIEVGDGAADPAPYVPRDPSGAPAADLIIFTARSERTDPCEAMRRHMQGRAKGQPAR